MSKNNYWTTNGGVKTKVEDLTESHFKNIIRDGYRNSKLLQEALRRGIKVPELAAPTIAEVLMFLESCASCAIEGNDFGDKVLAIHKEKGILAVTHIYNMMQNRDKFDSLNPTI